MSKILVIDDDRDICSLLNRFLTRKGYQVHEIYKGKNAIDYLQENTPDLILSDFRLEDMDGSVLLAKIKAIHPEVPVIIITGYSDIKTAVEIMKAGAFDYVVKPLLPDEILITIQKGLASVGNSSARVTESNPQPAAASSTTNVKKWVDTNGYVFGDTPVFKKLAQQIKLVGPTNYSVIIYGESGSGKEAIASEIHKQSKRSSKPFVAIDCGALSKELAGSELFGHEKGSFTGAVVQKTGSFEIANGGTIFLDEISNLSYDIQVSLLRVVQERKIRRVGSTKDIDLDVRILIASNEKLWDKARTGKFREDLYHRFNEFSIEVPPLRERKEDIMLFANHFLQQTNEELGKNVKSFTKEVEDIFLGYIWYGNLRELKNVIKRATLLSEGAMIEARYLPFEISNFNKLQFETSFSEPAVDTAPEPPEILQARKPVSFPDANLKAASIDVEYEMIIEVLKKCNFNKTKAAKLLNIDRKTLYNKMRQYQELSHSQNP
ncbi:MAG: sigma-54-dependent Fis family transcriptional regulator [Chitinophagaceae bacterium]|nr:sigma-54-dependent Fis family transcriptional regulator [Chitinophagaceae bacterium]